MAEKHQPAVPGRPDPTERADARQVPRTYAPSDQETQARAATPRDVPQGDDGRTSTTRHAQEWKEEAKSTARDLGHRAEDRAQRWTSSAGRQAESLARALRVARDSLWTEGEERMAKVVEQAADEVDRMSGYLEDENPSAMLDDLADLGRRNPGAFLGSAFTIGLAAGRFLRASSPERHEAPVGAEAGR